MSIKLRDAIRMVNRSTVTSLGALAIAGASNIALAQQPVIEEVVVSGIQGALRQAIDAKRNAVATIDAISSEDIGKFPDKNIAESLQRVPGVSIKRGFSGEGNEVSIRGANPELTSVLLNGQYVASTGWFSQGSNTRSFNMDLMPSEMVDRIEVYKSPTAMLDEGGVGGTVVVHTRKPLELDSMTAFVSADLNQVDIDDKETGLGYTGMLSWKNDNQTFGILGMFSTAETIGRAHKAENYWEEGWSGSGISEFNQDRERDAIDLTAQFAPTNELEFDLHYFKSEQAAANTNQNFLVINGGVPPVPAHDWAAGTEGGTPTASGLSTVGTLNGGFHQLAADINTREASLETETIHLSGLYEIDNMSVTAQIGSTEAVGGNGGSLNSLWGVSGNDLPSGVSVEVDFDSGSSMQLNPVGLNPDDGSWQVLQAAPALGTTELTDEEDFAQIDLDFMVDYGLITNIKTGLKMREHTFSNRKFNATYDGDDIVVDVSTLDDWRRGSIDHSGADGALRDSPTDLARISSSFNSEVRSNLTIAVEDPGGYGVVAEDATALYLQSDLEGDAFSGNFGMRYVETDVTGTRYNAAGDGFEKDEGSYSDWLPTINLKVDLTEDVILRLSAARVMSRPGYSSMSPSYTVFNETTQQASKGNIRIDPFRATQGDIGFEWYFDEDAILSATYFFKDIKSFVTTAEVTEVLNGPRFGAASYTVTTPVNGTGGEMQGLELQYQQSFGNYGVIANYTYVDAVGTDQDGNSVDLPGASQNSYNLTGYYENDDFTARLAYSYRSEFLAEGLGIGGSSRFLDQDYLDGSMVWHATENVDVSLEAVNLLGELIRENQDGSGRLRNHSDTGTRYYVKVSARF